MKKLITMIMMAVMSSTAMADQLIFSQYDGVNSWENIYIEVQDAKAYPGAFIDGVPGTVHSGVKGKAGVAGVEGVAEIKQSGTINYRFNIDASFSSDLAVDGSIKYTDISEGEFLTKEISHMNGTATADGSGISIWQQEDIIGQKDEPIRLGSVLFTNPVASTNNWDNLEQHLKDNVELLKATTGISGDMHNETATYDFTAAAAGVEAVEEEEEVLEVKPTREDPQVRRTIVSVPEGVDMNAFISEFLK